MTSCVQYQFQAPADDRGFSFPLSKVLLGEIAASQSRGCPTLPAPFAGGWAIGTVGASPRRSRRCAVHPRLKAEVAPPFPRLLREGGPSTLVAKLPVAPAAAPSTAGWPIFCYLRLKAEVAPPFPRFLREGGPSALVAKLPVAPAAAPSTGGWLIFCYLRLKAEVAPPFPRLLREGGPSALSAQVQGVRVGTLSTAI